MLVVIALLVPALFNYTERGIFASTEASSLDEKLSLSVAVVLLVVYAANLVYTLVTHRDVFELDEPPESGKQAWPLWRAIAVLVAATAATAWMAELVSGALEQTASAIGVSTFFLGVIVLAVIGNTAEYLSSIYFARQGRIGLVASITIGSTIQVALLVAPILVLVSHVIGHPMNLVFDNPLELIAIASVAFVVNAITRDGEATWFEGVLLVAVYVLLAFAFFFATPPPGRLIHEPAHAAPVRRIATTQLGGIMANASGKCAHSSCQCSVDAGQTYCSPSCQQQAQQSQGRQQSQQGGGSASSGASQCGCGHAACAQHSA